MDRGGASFVAFSDGRARGAFADRTIVTLGAPFSYLPLPQGAGTAGRAAALFGAVPPAGGDRGSEEEEDREIECIRPDGTVVRLTERSLAGPRGRLGGGGSGGGACSTARASSPYGTASCDGDRRRAFDPTAAVASSAAARRAGHGGPLSTAPPAVADGAGSSGLRPYVVAVLRFAAWAATPPAERRAAAENGAVGRRAAAVEAERNRRFVDLQRVAKLASTSPRARARQKPGSPPMKSRSSGGGGRGGLADERRPPRGGGAFTRGWRGGGGRTSAGGSDPQGAENVVGGGDGKENLDCCSSTVLSGRKQGVVAGRERGAPSGAAERNALVERLLEANLELLIRR